MNKLTTLIRRLLAVILIYFIYLETGWATATFAALVLIGSEINGAHDSNGRLNESSSKT